MKVSKKDTKVFRPVVITLESEEEVRIMFGVCNRNLTVERAINVKGSGSFLGALYTKLYQALGGYLS